MSDDGKNEARCIWCADGDGSLLMYCDTCRYSFCKNCVRRNFGHAEAQRVEKEKWLVIPFLSHTL